MYLIEKHEVWILFSYVSIQSLSSEGTDASRIAVFPYTTSTAGSLNASKPETSAHKKQVGVQLWIISGVDQKAF